MACVAVHTGEKQSHILYHVWPYILVRITENKVTFYISCVAVHTGENNRKQSHILWIVYAAAFTISFIAQHINCKQF